MGGTSDDAGVFEFDQLSGDESDSDPADPPDEPDSADDNGASENAPVRAAAGNEPSAGDDVPNEPRSVEASDSSTTVDSAGDAQSEETESDDGSESTDGDGTESTDGDGSGSDPPDPPDPSDGGSGDSTLSEFDPVDESQKAFRFAEKQSRAAAESAYKHAADSLLGRVVKKYLSPEVRQRLDEVFSRRMLGSVMVGGAFSKIIESVLGVSLGSASPLRPAAWGVIFLLATAIFVWWEHLARQASEAAQKASETAERASEAATEAAQKASETAEKASEAATGESPTNEAAQLVGVPKDREEGATAATRAGGRRPSAVRARSRAPERRPNKRFDGEDTDSLPTDAVDAAETTAPVFEGTGFNDPGDAEDA